MLYLFLHSSCTLFEMPLAHYIIPQLCCSWWRKSWKLARTMWMVVQFVAGNGSIDEDVISVKCYLLYDWLLFKELKVDMFWILISIIWNDELRYLKISGVIWNFSLEHIRKIRSNWQISYNYPLSLSFRTANSFPTVFRFQEVSQSTFFF